MDKIIRTIYLVRRILDKIWAEAFDCSKYKHSKMTQKIVRYKVK